MLQKIISGGQTGADRAALDAALILNFPCGGFCPKDRQAEDGPIDPKYPLEEIDGGYRQRTWQNVIHSDGTVIFFETEATGGTLLTSKYCQTHRKPQLLIDTLSTSVETASSAVEDFLKENNISDLNVAGPRASEHPNMYAFVHEAIRQVIQSNHGPKNGNEN